MRHISLHCTDWSISSVVKKYPPPYPQPPIFGTIVTWDSEVKFPMFRGVLLYSLYSCCSSKDLIIHNVLFFHQHLLFFDDSHLCVRSQHSCGFEHVFLYPLRFEMFSFKKVYSWSLNNFAVTLNCIICKRIGGNKYPKCSTSYIHK